MLGAITIATKKTKAIKELVKYFFLLMKEKKVVFGDLEFRKVIKNNEKCP